MGYDYEKQGTAYDSGAAGHELTGRERAPAVARCDLPLAERVAREIAMEIMEVHTDAERSAFDWPDDASGDTIDRARHRARLIFEAMREPTDDMAAHGARAMMAEPSDQQTRREVGAAYRAMIDAARKEPAQPKKGKAK